MPTPGFKVEILDENGKQASPGEQGSVVVKRPLPPSCLPTVWGNQTRFEEGYLNTYPGYYLSGDGGFIDEEGYVFIMGRTCLLYTSPSPRDRQKSRMPSSA